MYDVGLYGDRLTAHAIPSTHLGFRSKYDPLASARFVNWVRREQFDIVHTHGWPPIFLGSIAARFAPRTRFFVTEHSSSNRRRSHNLRLLERWIYRPYERIIPVSKAAARGLHAWLPETTTRAQTIYNGISFARLAEAHPSSAASVVRAMPPPVILSASGSEPHKGADVLVEALRERQDRPFTLALAGAGRRDAELVARVQHAGLQARTRRLGYVPDVHLLMPDAAMLVVPSRREGCPMVILEAMAMQTPIVASAVGGVPELVEDGKSARLVPPDNPAALGDALACILSDSAEVARLTLAAREQVERFSAARQSQAIAELYHKS
jgi:glycosyltransferase involved in cell wall biosynthesis